MQVPSVSQLAKEVMKNKGHLLNDLELRHSVQDDLVVDVFRWSVRSQLLKVLDVSFDPLYRSQQNSLQTHVVACWVLLDTLKERFETGVCLQREKQLQNGGKRVREKFML